MEKKTIVSMGILIAVTAAFLWMNQPSETKVNSQQSSTTIQKKPTTEPSPQSDVPNDVEEACKSAAERFVRVKSEGRSSDIFLHADRNDTSRYLVRMRVQWIDGKARIYKMVEESSLGNGFYEK